MKKIALIILTMTFGFAAFAEGFTNNIQLGAAVPVSVSGIDSRSKIQQTGITFNAAYLGIWGNGAAIKVNSFVGSAVTDNLPGSGGTEYGFKIAFDIGAGYAFINSDRFTVAVTGMFGGDFSRYSLSRNSADYEMKAFSVSTGADVTGICRITKNIGAYADTNFRWTPKGFSHISTDYVYESAADFDVFTFITALGLVIAF